MPSADDRVPILYLAPWLDIGGSDKGTLDWFRFLDRDRFRPSLITTQPSPNRRLHEATAYADEVWDLPELMHGDEFARFIVSFIDTRAIKIVHLMNSRLGFELLPEIAALPDAPRIVVQLHVEEPDCSGYVRYVTTRYGNLVDAFSVSSQALSDALDPYDVPVAKRRLIRTGVDAQREFCPSRVSPVDGLEPNLFHVLFPARITDQKDPLLMIEVADRLRADGLRFRIHFLGEGGMREVVQERIATAGLANEIIMHGERVDVAPWYAGCDTVLLTSSWEGLPYVAYEAMAMATPIVAPDLPGLREVLTAETGVLVSPRGDLEAYAKAIRALAADPARRRRIGTAARARALSEFSLERMAQEHCALYDELLATSSRAEPTAPPDLGRAASDQRPIGGLRSRRPSETPLVSVVIPCFNDGHYLHACLQSIAEQTYDPIETIVVNNGSTDRDTLDVLTGLERDGIEILHVQENRGPSGARNAAIERAKGRYVLPVDADNLLLPGAVAALVEQLASAGEQIGFVYPNYQFFGNRTDYFEPPSYNLHALLGANYCDTCSLIDREVFDRGFRYPEDLVLGFEDWDLVLTLAEHGIYGEPARSKTLLYRRHGFTRVDLVEAAGVPLHDVNARQHPSLFDLRARARLKGEWRPAVTIVAIDALPDDADDPLRNLVAAASRQTCEDFEVIVRTASEFWPTELGRRLRRIPAALAESRAQALAHGLEIARGRYVLATYGSPAALLAESPMIEKTLRVLRTNPAVNAVALAEGERGLPTFRLLASEAVERASLGALCWDTTGATAPPLSLKLSGQLPLQTVARWLSAHTTLQWRHVARRDRRAVRTEGLAKSAALGAPRYARSRDARLRAETSPELPGFASEVSPRLRWPNVWKPPWARLLCRHLHHESGHYFFTNDRAAPPGCSFQYALGCVRGLPLRGTTSLLSRVNGEFPELAFDEPAELDAPELLGFFERAPLPLFDPLMVGRHRETGQLVLIAGAEDPLAGLVNGATGIGYVEPYPIHPRHPPHVDVAYGLIGLVRTVDLHARRHRYGAGNVPAGRPAGELGALLSEPSEDCEPVWIDRDGHASVGQNHATNRRPSIRTAMRWTAAPIGWRGGGPIKPRIRSTARRAYDSARSVLAPISAAPSGASGEPSGYLLRCPDRQALPLYSATHPVTGDQLLSTDETEAKEFGYGSATRLGYLIARAPVTGRLGPMQAAVPWASRFGRRGGN